MATEIIYKDLSYQVVGVMYEVHNELNRYANEKQYGDALECKLKERSIPYIREYKFVDQRFDSNQARCIVDFMIDGKIILEIKAKLLTTKEDYFQLQRYLTTLNIRLGMLVNFRQPHLRPKRIVNKFYVAR